MHDQMVRYCDLLFRCWCVIHLCLSFLCMCGCCFSCCAGAAAVGAVAVTVLPAAGSLTAHAINSASNGVTVQTRAAGNWTDPCLSSSFREDSQRLRTIHRENVPGTAGSGQHTLRTTHHGTRHRTAALTAHENERTRCRALRPSAIEERALRGRWSCAICRWRVLACES